MTTTGRDRNPATTIRCQWCGEAGTDELGAVVRGYHADCRVARHSGALATRCEGASEFAASTPELPTLCPMCGLPLDYTGSDFVVEWNADMSQTITHTGCADV
jgi:hypothetical protein